MQKWHFANLNAWIGRFRMLMLFVLIDASIFVQAKCKFEIPLDFAFVLETGMQI